jgi:hypothetical protein
MPLMNDLEFDDKDLVFIDGKRVYGVDGVFPGGITVIDGNGEAVMADQIERVGLGGVVDGVNVVLDDFLVDGHLEGTWKIRYNRGARGHDSLSASLSDATLDEIILYSLIFG